MFGLSPELIAKSKLATVKGFERFESESRNCGLFEFI